MPKTTLLHNALISSRPLVPRADAGVVLAAQMCLTCSQGCEPMLESVDTQPLHWWLLKTVPKLAASASLKCKFSGPSPILLTQLLGVGPSNLCVNRLSR